MREVIFVGSKDFVLENREIARQRMRQVFEENWLGLPRGKRYGPIFIGEFRKQSVFQSAFQLKFEIRARLRSKMPLWQSLIQLPPELLRAPPEHQPA